MTITNRAEKFKTIDSFLTFTSSFRSSEFSKEFLCPESVER